MSPIIQPFDMPQDRLRSARIELAAAKTKLSRAEYEVAKLKATIAFWESERKQENKP